MAEGLLHAIDPSLDVASAGTFPALQVHPLAVTVMRERGIDISRARPKHVDLFVHRSFDFIITVCDNARESCPVFTGTVGRTLHLPFEDPSFATGTEEQRLGEFRRIRDEIDARFRQFHATDLAHPL